MTFVRLLIVTAFLAFAAVLQMTASFSVAIGPARPDFVLTTLCCASVLVNYESGAAAGVWAGQLMAAVVGVNYGSFLVSRALTGAFCGWLNQRFLRDDFLVPPLVTFGATFVCEGIYFLMAPTAPPDPMAGGRRLGSGL